ncbi:hypothetical protein EDB89DRAFT_1913521 [Lactarius sanguifluus]|nr:hypothetical protein EDB89DRAFT_1913521 [Lactarius sanguifluus]
MQCSTLPPPSSLGRGQDTWVNRARHRHYYNCCGWDARLRCRRRGTHCSVGLRWTPSSGGCEWTSGGEALRMQRGGTWVSWSSAVAREQVGSRVDSVAFLNLKSVEAAVGWVYETKRQRQKNRQNVPPLLFAVPADSTYCLTNSIVTAATIPPHPAVLVPPSFVDAAGPGSATSIHRPSTACTIRDASPPDVRSQPPLLGVQRKPTEQCVPRRRQRSRASQPQRL